MAKTYLQFKKETLEKGYKFLDNYVLIKDNVIYEVDEIGEYIINDIAYFSYEIKPTGEYKNCESCNKACCKSFNGDFIVSCSKDNSYIGILGDDAKEHCCDSWEY